MRPGSTQALLPVAPRQIEFETTAIENRVKESIVNIHIYQSYSVSYVFMYIFIWIGVSEPRTYIIDLN